MDPSRPATVVTSRVDAGVLQVLYRTSGLLTGREIARLAADISQPAVQASLARFVRHGLVTVESAGRAHLYALNREHLAMPAVELLVAMRSRLIDRLRAEVEAWNPAAVHVSLFGSVARGEGTTESDIDLLIVRPNGASADDQTWHRQVADLERAVEQWTGNRLAPVDVTLNDLAVMSQARRQLLADIRRDAVTVFGSPVGDVLPAERGGTR
jgi:predicted nucleotidyltransferase